MHACMHFCMVLRGELTRPKSGMLSAFFNGDMPLRAMITRVGVLGMISPFSGVPFSELVVGVVLLEQNAGACVRCELKRMPACVAHEKAWCTHGDSGLLRRRCAHRLFRPNERIGAKRGNCRSSKINTGSGT